MDWSPQLMGTIVAVVVLGAITTTVLLRSRVRAPWAPVLAVLRGAIQLALIGLVLGGIITDPLWVAAAVLVMFTVAVGTVARRVGGTRRELGAIALSMALAILVSLTVVFGTGAIEFSSRYVLALGGIAIGGVMQITTLAGRDLHSGIRDRWDEVEGWLALGATSRQSTLEIARGSVYASLVPSTDQTKTAGLVALPGSFVGAIFGGASPLEAARFQVVVLAVLLAAGAVSATLLVRLLGAVRVRPVAR